MTRLRPLLLPACLLGLALLFFWKQALTNLVVAQGDLFYYFYPYWEYRAQAFRAGDLPLWNPYLFMGVPFLANSQAGVLYPPNWPLAWLPAPAALKGAVLSHFGLAALGAYGFARRVLGQAREGAFVSAMLFSLGGYLLAQADHVNQLQALAWFPLLLWSSKAALAGPHRPRKLALAGLVVALQVLAGHTQSAFISIGGLFCYLLVDGLGQPSDAHGSPWPVRLRRALQPALLGTLAPAALGGLIAGAQLLPTFELSTQSLRHGGLSLREAISFSLHPLLAGRALLPSYSRSLATEFVASIGIVGLGLAAAGVIGARHDRGRRAMLVLAVAGLFLALGGYNPLYYVLAWLPPFNLFRAPARWSFLFAFGAAMLAGYGLDRLRQAEGERPRPLVVFGPAIALVIWSLTAAGVTAPGETGPLGLPTALEWVGWTVALVALAVAMRNRWKRSAAVLIGLVGLELFAASRPMSFNHPTFPEALTSLRPAITQLLVAQENRLPPGRYLSLSTLQFDPGDLPELQSAWATQLPAREIRDAIVATKAKEVLSPNLSLAWRIPSMDGFDGGLLPLARYVDFEALFVPSDRVASDGRLRENLDQVPAYRILQSADVQFLVTDKLGDAWVDGVFYDRQFALKISSNESATIDALPPFQATTVGLLIEGGIGWVSLDLDSGESVSLDLPAPDPRSGAARLRLPATARIQRLTFHAGDDGLTVRGLALIDERSGAFQGVTLGPYRLLHSGDVKVYETREPLSRAYLVGTGVLAANDAEALRVLASEEFDPSRSVVLSSGQPLSRPDFAGEARVQRYEPEHVTVMTASDSPGYLVLSDAFYPGWSATVDGQPATIERANLLFRAVALSAGPHTVEFHYQPRSFAIGLGLTIVGSLLALWLLLSPARRPS